MCRASQSSIRAENFIDGVYIDGENLFIWLRMHFKVRVRPSVSVRIFNLALNNELPKLVISPSQQVR